MEKLNIPIGVCKSRASISFLSTFPPLPTNTMSTLNDVDSVFFLSKENLWRKNELAHQRMRTKPSNSPYCTYCHHRRCGDPNTVYGNRSLKKSKVCAWRTTKVDRTRVDMDPFFLNARNGEQFVDSVNQLPSDECIGKYGEYVSIYGSV